MTLLLTTEGVTYTAQCNPKERTVVVRVRYGKGMDITATLTYDTADTWSPRYDLKRLVEGKWVYYARKLPITIDNYIYHIGGLFANNEFL